MSIEEIKRSIHDFEFFARRCLRVRSKDGRIVPMHMNRAQKEIYSAIRSQEERGLPIRIVILKCRQAGVSTFVQAYCYWKCVTRANIQSLCMAHRVPAAENIFQAARMYYELQPPPKPMVRYSSKRELYFAHPSKKSSGGMNSRIVVLSSEVAGGARSYAFQLLHLSEVAYYADPYELAGSLIPALPPHPGTACFLESTGNADSEYWYDLWEKTISGENEYIGVFIPWYYIDEYKLEGEAAKIWLDYENKGWKRDLDTYEAVLLDKHGLTPQQLAWRRMMISNIGEERFRTEFPTTWQDAFTASAACVFDHQSLMKCLDEDAQPVFVGEITVEEIDRERKHVLTMNPDGRFTVWEMPERGVEYVVGVDTSVGVSTGSYAAAVVVKYDGEKWVQVAEWHGHADPVQFSKYVEGIGRFYNEAILTIEIQGTGYGVQSAINEHYTRFFRWRRWDEPSLPVTKKLGWSTQPSTKPMLIGFFKHVVDSGGFVIRSSKLADEMLNYIHDPVRQDTRAASGFFDDLVMAAAMAVFGYWVEHRPKYKSDLDMIVIGMSRKEGNDEGGEELSPTDRILRDWFEGRDAEYANYSWDSW